MCENLVKKLAAPFPFPPSPELDSSPRTALKHLLQILDSHWRSPESGNVWYKSRQLTKTIWYRVKKLAAPFPLPPSPELSTCLRTAPNHLFQVLDLYWRSPESGTVWHKSRQLKRTIWYLVKKLAAPPSPELDSCRLRFQLDPPFRSARRVSGDLHQIVLVNCLHLYRSSSDSSARQCKIKAI